MTFSQGAGLRILIIVLAILIGMQMVMVGTGVLMRISSVSHPARAAVVEQIVATTNLLDEMPDEKRADALRAVSSPFLRFSIIDAFPDAEEERAPLRAYRPLILAYKAAFQDRPFRTFIRRRGSARPLLNAARMRFRPPEVVIVAKLSDGKALVAEPDPSYRRRMMTNVLAFASSLVGLALLGGLVWASFATSRPLARMASAAENLASDLNAPPIPEDGPEAVRHLARALNKMQHDIRRLVSERTVTLAAVAHDFRTYLTRLRLRAEFISDETQREKTISDLDEMTALIDDTLLLARDDENADEKEEVDIAELVRGVADAFSETGATTTFESDGASLSARVHERSLRRAIANLMDNAIKYGSVAHTKASRSADAIIVTISDEGTGVPPEDLARLTEPFYRAEASRSRMTGGAGLGLTIAKKMVESSGGTLTIRNGATGGLVAEIRLPASAPSSS